MIPTDEIISMAMEARKDEDVNYDEFVFIMTERDLTRFVSLVSARAAKDEREACAKVCDDRKKDWHKNENYHSGYMAAGAGICAKKIRARGESA